MIVATRMVGLGCASRSETWGLTIGGIVERQSRTAYSIRGRNENVVTFPMQNRLKMRVEDVVRGWGKRHRQSFPARLEPSRDFDRQELLVHFAVGDRQRPIRARPGPLSRLSRLRAAVVPRSCRRAGGGSRKPGYDRRRQVPAVPAPVRALTARGDGRGPPRGLVGSARKTVGWACCPPPPAVTWWAQPTLPKGVGPEFPGKTGAGQIDFSLTTARRQSAGAGGMTPAPGGRGVLIGRPATRGQDRASAILLPPPPLGPRAGEWPFAGGPSSPARVHQCHRQSTDGRLGPSDNREWSPRFRKRSPLATRARGIEQACFFSRVWGGPARTTRGPAGAGRHALVRAVPGDFLTGMVRQPPAGRMSAPWDTNSNRLVGEIGRPGFEIGQGDRADRRGAAPICDESPPAQLVGGRFAARVLSPASITPQNGPPPASGRSAPPEGKRPQREFAQAGQDRTTAGEKLGEELLRGSAGGREGVCNSARGCPVGNSSCWGQRYNSAAKGKSTPPTWSMPGVNSRGAVCGFLGVRVFC